MNLNKSIWEITTPFIGIPLAVSVSLIDPNQPTDQVYFDIIKGNNIELYKSILQKDKKTKLMTAIINAWITYKLIDIVQSLKDNIVNGISSKEISINVNSKNKFLNCFINFIKHPKNLAYIIETTLITLIYESSLYVAVKFGYAKEFMTVFELLTLNNDILTIAKKYNFNEEDKSLLRKFMDYVTNLSSKIRVKSQIKDDHGLVSKVLRMIPIRKVFSYTFGNRLDIKDYKHISKVAKNDRSKIFFNALSRIVSNIMSVILLTKDRVVLNTALKVTIGLFMKSKDLRRCIRNK